MSIWNILNMWMERWRVFILLQRKINMDTIILLPPKAAAGFIIRYYCIK